MRRCISPMGEGGEVEYKFVCLISASKFSRRCTYSYAECVGSSWTVERMAEGSACGRCVNTLVSTRYRGVRVT